MTCCQATHTAVCNWNLTEGLEGSLQGSHQPASRARTCQNPNKPKDFRQKTTASLYIHAWPHPSTRLCAMHHLRDCRQ